MNALPEARVTVAMLGARMHYAVPRLLFEAGLLDRFFTDSYIGNKPGLKRAISAIPPALRPHNFSKWLGRDDPRLPPERVISFESLGWQYALSLRRATSPMERQGVMRMFNRRFADAILRHPGFASSGTVFGFNGASVDLFREARKQGRICILEQTIYPERLTRRLMAEAHVRWRGWVADGASTMPTDEPPEEEEWALADRILCGSEFVRSGLVALGVPPQKIHVVPYGVSPQHFPISGDQPEESRRRPLRLLFAGRDSLRKGLPALLQALDLLPPDAYDARLVGRSDLSQAKAAQVAPSIKFMGDVPRSSMAELYRWADVFVCPSVAEGSATVTYEALMSGVSVIATPNAGSPVRDGIDGVLVPLHESGALADALRKYIEDPALLARHRAAAAADRLRLGLNSYGERLVKALQKEANAGSGAARAPEMQS